MLIKPGKKKTDEGCAAYRKVKAGKLMYCSKKRACVTGDDCQWCDERQGETQELDSQVKKRGK